MNRSLTVALALATTTALAACRHGGGDGLTGDGAIAEESIDSSELSLTEASLFAAALEGAPTGSDGVLAAGPDTIAAYIADRVANQYTPPACVTTQIVGAVVTVTFDSCTGPFGLVLVDGVVVFTVRPSLGSVTVDATADALIIGGATLDLDATAVYTATLSSQSIDVTTRTTGTGPLGHELDHTGDYVVTWDATCASIDGYWATQAGEAQRSTTASVERCVAACPTGVITRETIDDRTITITFDGTNRATWTSSGGRSGTIPLLCP